MSLRNIFILTILFSCVMNNQSKLSGDCRNLNNSKNDHFIAQDLNAPRQMLQIAVEESEVIKQLCMKLLAFSNHFNPASGSKVSSKCKHQTKEYFTALQELNLWALKMFDSSARINSGILNGNINQFGDFDQCLQAQNDDSSITGQYCLVYIQPKIIRNLPHTKRLYKLIQSHNAFSSGINDPGHRIPRFSLINWALCIPVGCSSLDIENSLQEYMANLTKNFGISVDVRVDSQMCQSTKNEIPLSLYCKLTILFFTTVLLICGISTIYESRTKAINEVELLSSFSLRKNFNWLVSTDSSPNDIKTVHGIRFINALMLLFSHKSMAVFFNPYINRTQLSEALGKQWTVIGRAASLYTDPFLLFSGMLTTYSVIGRLEAKQSGKIWHEYSGRLLRILPTLIALILFCTHILPLLGSGPQWNLVVQHHSELCQKYWWRNILFIHNYFGFSNMCLTHTHHLGIDTQLFIFTPIVTVFLWKRPQLVLTILFTLIFVTTIARFHITAANELSNYVYFGATINRMFKTADCMYISPPHRSTVYIMGIILGYCLKKYKGMRLSKTKLHVGWFLCITCFFATVIAPAPMSNINYKYSPIHAAFYAAFAPIGWCLIFIWIIFTAHLGYSSFLSEALSWHGFQITTKLSYAVYLTQFPVFFYNVGQRRNAGFYSFLPTMLNLNEYACIVTASILLTLMFDAPFQNIKKMLWRNSKLVTSIKKGN